MKENMDKSEEETNEYVEKKSVKKKKGKKMNKEVVKELGENNIAHETGSSILEKKKNKERKLEKVNGDFVDSGESNKSDTLEKERMMEMGNGKKKKEKKESESNEMYKVFEDKESGELKTLERERMTEMSNSRKNSKKKKENKLEEVHKELVEVENGTKTAILEKESMIELIKDKKKKKSKKKEIVSENVNKEVISGEKFGGNSKYRGSSTLEDDTMINPEKDDKNKKKRDKEDIELNENQARKSGVIIDTGNGERNKKRKKKMEDNKESTIDEELRSSSTQSINREAVDKKRERKDKKVDNKVSHLDKKTKSSVENKNSKKNKLPHFNEEQKSLSTKKKRKTIGDSEAVESSSSRKKKRKLDDGTEGEGGNKKKSKKDNGKNDVTEDAQKANYKKIDEKLPNSEPKRVSFSSNVEVFPINEDDSTEKVYYEKIGDGSIESIYNEKNDFRGKRFSPYEDQLVRDAVQKYIDKNHLGEDGIQKIINCHKTPEARMCWKEISKDLPWRNEAAVYSRGRHLLQVSECGNKHGFSEEEIKRIMDFHAENGPKWVQLGKELKRSSSHIKDAYRRKRLKEVSRGRWTQDEYQKLFDLVHENICAKIHEKKINKNPMIRDGISWEAISEKMKTRAMAYCCSKWYDSLASPLVREKKWSEPDDYRLLDALYYQEGCCEEDVDWGNLVESRPGEYCMKRWNEMVRHIGEYKERSFRDQINLLKERYDISMLKHVEALKNRKEGGADEEEKEDEHDVDKDKEGE